MTSIYDKVKRILKDKCKGKEFCELEYEDFKKSFPVLFDKIMDDECFDIDNMKYMFNQLEKMNNSKLSQHDASVKVGEYLVEKYIKPQLNEEI